MRLTIFLTFLFLTNYSLGQSTRNELANSKLYVCATYFEKKNKNIGLETKKILKDTVIQNITFTKYEIEHFTDYSQEVTRHAFYEAFKDSFYYLLDDKLKSIHKLNFQTNSP